MGKIKFFPDNLDIQNQKVILRLDLNVPIREKIIQDDTRIILCLPFIKRLIEKKAKIIIISHLGRPKGLKVPEFTSDDDLVHPNLAGYKVMEEIILNALN